MAARGRSDAVKSIKKEKVVEQENYQIPDFDLEEDELEIRLSQKTIQAPLLVKTGENVTVAKAARYHPVHKSIEPHFSLSCSQGVIKIRCTTLDFDDKELKPKPLNSQILVIDRQKAIISEVSPSEMPQIKESDS